MSKMAKEIRVGIIGGNANAGWTKLSHVPAIKALPGLRLAAVATRNEQSARAAAETFGADRWFSDPYAMMRDDEIDLVTISVKVPAHRDLVLAALEAGKAVYCESPLGRCVAEAEEMARAVRSNHTAIGLQGRHNPAVRRAAELVSSGRIGQPLNATIRAPTVGWGPELSVAYDFLNKLSSGVDLLTVTGGHTLDLAEMLLGPIIEVKTRAETRWPVVKLIDSGEESVREVPDYVAVNGKTRSGALFSAELEGGVQPENLRFSFELRGSEGWLRLTSNSSFGFQAGHVQLTSNVAFNEPEATAVPGGTVETAINVGEVYAQLARDLRDGAYRTPGFDHALANARLIDAVRAAEWGERRKPADRRCPSALL